ncbi:hypothetical protein Dvar_49910 [Desulfosarcina variabilis str. Montpellier]|uniref:hypothetical protein n=1 Tax=Desulfosarcina variabilis TaxID=2300 RepID=UPI003AFA192E
MMDPTNMLKQMVSFNKAAFENSFKSFVRMQEQAEQMTIDLCDKTPYFPEAGKEAMGSYAAAHKNLHDHFFAVMDDGFKKVEAYLAD